MKRFRILCVLLLIGVFVGGFQEFVSNVLHGFRLGWGITNYAMTNGLDYNTDVCLDVTPKGIIGLKPNAVNVLTGDSIIVVPDRLSVTSFFVAGEPKQSESTFLVVVENIMYFAVLIIFVVIAVYFVRIMVAFSRNKIFDRRIQKWMLRIGCSFLVIAFCQTVWSFLTIYQVSETVELADFSFRYGRSIDWNNITMGLLVLALNEIITVATRYKEDQDLTI